MFDVTSNTPTRGLELNVSRDGKTIYIGYVPKRLIEAQLGANADKAARKDWAIQNSILLTTAIIAKYEGKTVDAPFDQVEAKGTKDAN